ncbi:uncharacterized protein LOC117169836 [Belonocnema kinseyi]|uniref:uncharacterized protein LOC117169836 n=1 Tax=Belonocnema kinseyi TaxID=2817044 RepID=UPI00143D7DDE|nr:uncharacterized protein LOC117169836 [Belonocnema kinseyi]
MRILISELVKFHGFYPSEKAKIALAKAIVRVLPLLKDDHSTKVYEHYYDNETRRVFIEFRLWTLRKKLSPSKKYRTNPQGHHKEISNNLHELLLSTEELDLKIDNQGKHIFKEKGDNFLAKFPSYYCPRILEYAKLNLIDIYKKSQNLRALIILANLLSPNNARQNSLKRSLGETECVNNQPESARPILKRPLSIKEEIGSHSAKEPRIESSSDNGFYVITTDLLSKFHLLRRAADGIESTSVDQEMNDDLSTFLIRFVPCVNDDSARVSTNIQPYIVCVKGQNNRNSFFVQGDGWFVQPHNCNPFTAFDLLFKTYFALNLCYPGRLNNFYNFIETYVYSLGKKSRGVVTSLNVNLSNLKLDNACNASAFDDDNYMD